MQQYIFHKITDVHWYNHSSVLIKFFLGITPDSKVHGLH